MIPNHHANEGKIQMAKNSKKSAPIAAANLVFLATPMHVALFNEVLLDEIRTEQGRWFTVRTKDHHLPFLDCEAQVTPEGAQPGVQFVARKLNYNFNDSNWVGKAEVLKRLQEVALPHSPEGKEVPKKLIYALLEDIKNTLKASTFAPPAPAPEATPEVSEAAPEVAPEETKVDEAA